MKKLQQFGVKLFPYVFNVVVEEGNSFENPSMALNGGGYSQPRYTVTCNEFDGVTMVLCDTSCGDFGTRFSAVLNIRGYDVFSAYWGSMNGNGRTTFTKYGFAYPWLRIAKNIGFDIPVI